VKERADGRRSVDDGCVSPLPEGMLQTTVDARTIREREREGGAVIAASSPPSAFPCKKEREREHLRVRRVEMADSARHMLLPAADGNVKPRQVLGNKVAE